MSETYHTLVENQKEVLVEAYQGEDSTASKNTSIGSFSMTKLSKTLPRGSEIDISFEYNLNGIVEVTAQERKSGRKEKMQVDINRLTQVSKSEDVGTDSEQPALDALKEVLHEGRIERILKTARARADKTEDSELLKEIQEKVDMLEKALDEDSDKAMELSEELAQLVSDR